MRRGGEQHRQRLGVEHRGRLEDDGRDREEDDSREVQDLPPGPEEPQQHEQEHERRDRRERVPDLAHPLGVVEPEPIAELEAHAAHGEEAGRRVVAPRPGREMPVHQSARVVERLLRVVAGDRGIDQGVSNSDDPHRRDHAVRDGAAHVPAQDRRPHREGE